MAKRKFTILDAAIILIIAVGIGGIAYKYTSAGVTAPAVAKETIQITIFFEYMADSTIDAIKIGDPVREQVQNTSFGNVTEIVTGESIFWESREDGQFVKSGRQGYSSLYITAETQGLIKSDGIAIDKSMYYVGETLSLYAGASFLASGRISEAVRSE